MFRDFNYVSLDVAANAEAAETRLREFFATTYAAGRRG
jgi:hypothetical protein